MNIPSADIRKILDSFSNEETGLNFLFQPARSVTVKGDRRRARKMRRSVASPQDKTMILEFLGSKPNQVNKISASLQTGNQVVAITNLLILDTLLAAAYPGWRFGWIGTTQDGMVDGQYAINGRVRIEIMELNGHRLLMVEAK